MARKPEGSAVQKISVHQRVPVKGRQNQVFNPNEMYPNQKTTPQQNTGSDEIRRHKLSSSQLIHFLRTSRSPKQVSELASSADEVEYRTNITEASLRLMQQNSNVIATGNQRVMALTSAKKVESEVSSEGKVSEPVFAEKPISVDCVAYNWMITTNSELWDAGNIFSDANHSTAKTFPNEMDEFLFQDDWKVANLSSQSVCPSKEESCKGSSTLADEPEDGDGAHVRIPEFQSRKFEETPVVITHVVHPNKFFIQHKNTNLCELSENMLCTNSSRSFAEMNSIPDIGAYVMTWLPKQEIWCRGRVIKICQLSRDIKAEVRRIDYGDDVCVSLRDIKEMSGEIASRPVQALQVSLANVRPVNGETWSFEAISWFRSKVQNKTLYARIYPEGEVELFMEKGKIGAMRRGDSLSERLAQNRFAIHRCNKRKGLKRSDVQEQTRQRSLEWEKYLISCYR